MRDTLVKGGTVHDKLKLVGMEAASAPFGNIREMVVSTIEESRRLTPAPVRKQDSTRSWLPYTGVRVERVSSGTLGNSNRPRWKPKPLKPKLTRVRGIALRTPYRARGTLSELLGDRLDSKPAREE